MKNGITGHRGNPKKAPENTIPSFLSAIELGVDWIELDIHTTKDGKLAVIHDFDTGRVGDLNVKIVDTSFAELSKIDVACLFRMEHALNIEKCPPHQIPSLEEVLQLALSRPGTRISIQPKSDCVKEALALIKYLGAENIVGFNDGSLEKMLEVKRNNKRIPIFWDRFDSDLREDIKTAVAAGFESIVCHCDYLDHVAVSIIKQHELKAGVWTVNDEKSMRRFLEMGVDRFYTDDPAMLFFIKQSIRQS